MLAQDHWALVKFFQALIKATIDYSLSQVTVSITFWWFLSAKEIQLKSFIGTSSWRFSQEWKTDFRMEIYLFPLGIFSWNTFIAQFFKSVIIQTLFYINCNTNHHPNKGEWEGGKLKYKNFNFFPILLNAYCLNPEVFMKNKWLSKL